MKKDDVWDEEINPNGISNPIKDLNKDVWDRGYFTETDDGIWYEVYVNDEVKSYNSIDMNNEEQTQMFSGFNSIYIHDYDEYNQITFFEANDEDEFTLNTLEEILI